MKAFYCVGTHWDREWYEPFQEFRMWLVELIDEVMDLMENDPRYACFHLDGQAVVLEDYLEIRPEERDRLVGHLQAGRLVAGPWYNLPDEWLISGESFVRNISRGMRVCRELGFEPADFAYTPDQFGHIAALPMIVAGFGLQAGVCWRGTQDEHFPTHFMWVGPDGSKVPYTKLTDQGSYSSFLTGVRAPSKEKGLTDELFKEHAEPYISYRKDRAAAPVILMIDAVDHQRPDPDMPALFEELQNRFPDIEFIWGSLPEYAAELVKHADNLEEYQGELRQPALDRNRLYQYLIVHTLSSRYPLKKRNDECQAMLEKWAEPYTLFQRMDGGAPVMSYLDKAWQWLLKNHPHDSICGCSIDQVHRDMHFRFDQAELLGDGLLRRAIAHIAKPDPGEAALRHIAVHNPLPFARKEVVELPVEFAKNWPARFHDGLATAEQVNTFKLFDSDGKELPFQLIRIERNKNVRRLNGQGRKQFANEDIHHVAVELDLPPCGYTGVTVEPTDEAVRNQGTLRTAPMKATNGVVDLSIEADGSVTLKHDGSGRSYARLFTYEDGGDSGDGWTYGRPIDDLVVKTPGSRVTTAVEEDGPLRTVFRIDRELDVPRRLDMTSRGRSGDRETLQLIDWLTIEKGLPGVRVRTVVNNTVTDHRLRVLFPTPIDARQSFAETPFAMVKRDVRIPPETATWHERVNEETAFTTLCGVSDAQGGLAVLAPTGLHEYAVQDTPQRVLALTLFRATYQTVQTAGEPDGELQQPLAFNYVLMPFAGAFNPVRARRIVDAAQAGVRTHGTAEPVTPRSFLRLDDGGVVVTAIKAADDGEGGVVRLWNPAEADLEEVIHTEPAAASAQLCDLNETPQQDIKLEDGAIPVTVKAGGLATVRFTW